MFYRNFTINHFEQLESTNSLAFNLVKSYQIDHNHIILADQQTGGKGRMGRNWVSPIGNLYFSLILKPQKTLAVASQLSFVASVAMGLAIAEFSHDTKQINYKWPNDILLEGKKVAGILLESDADFVVIGIGVNIQSHPDNTTYAACNLVEQGFTAMDKMDLLKKFLDNFSNLYQQWLDFGLLPIRNLWLEKAFNLNKEIIVNLPNQTLKGVFKDLDKDGNLVLDVIGKELVIASGEVFS